jgi:hypothetical protein
MAKQLSKIAFVAIVAIVALACFGVRAQESKRDIEERMRKLAAEKQQRKQALEKKLRGDLERLKPLMQYLLEDLRFATMIKVREIYDGAQVMSDVRRPKFLGVIADEFDTDSVFNEYGSYGTEYATDSIWNEYGDYGSPYSSESARNPYTSTPPYLLKKGKVIGRLTVSRHIADAVDPGWLKSFYLY